MPNLPEDLAQLLADCRLVVSYGIRSGRLPDDKLVSALAAGEAAVAKGQPDAVNTAGISAELQRAVQAIAPVTLKDLGSKWGPFVGSRRRIVRTVFVVFAGLLILATSYYSQLYTQANSILGQLTEIQSNKLREKSERLFRFYLKNFQQLYTVDKDSNDAVVFEPYLRSYEDLMTSYEKLSTYVPLSQSLNNHIGIPLVGELLESVRSLLGGRDGQYGIVPARNDPNYKGPEPIVQIAADPRRDAVVQGKEAGAEAGIKGPRGGYGEAESELALLRTKKEKLEGFLFALGADWYYARFLTTQIYESQRTVAMLGIWLLPALYGMLGATIFQLRAILDPMIPDPALERIFLRLTLGAFAGVSIFLVLGPTPHKIFDGTSSALSSFALCFLLGFSLDVFFSILDRLVTFVSQSVSSFNRVPAPGPSPPAAGSRPS